MNKYIEMDLVRVIEDLQRAVDVCYTAPEKDDQGYPYATGYSRAAMQSAITQLNSIKHRIK